MAGTTFVAASFQWQWHLLAKGFEPGATQLQRGRPTPSGRRRLGLVPVAQPHKLCLLWVRWDGREALRAAEVNKKLQEKTNESLVSNKASYLSMIHNIFGKYIDDVEKGLREPLEIKSINDLARLVGSALFIQGEGEDTKPLKLVFEEEAKEIDDLFKIAERGNQQNSITKSKKSR